MEKRTRQLVHKFRVRDGGKFRLKECDPGDTGGLDIDREEAQKMLAEGIERLSDLQSRLAAQDQWALLLIFQAIDAAGKDSTIRHVFSGLNPQGCQVTSFKQPSSVEIDHDFLWRTGPALPQRGQIGIFNRSYYEEVLIVRVHPEILQAEKLPAECVSKRIWKERYEDINGFEKHLRRNGTVVRKFFLHVSKKEQKKRFLERIEMPDKNWKFSMADVHERERWNDYMEAYEEMICATSTKRAPWYVVPADHKWFTHLVVAAAVAEALEEMRVRFPKVDTVQKQELAAARRKLLRT